MIQMKRILNQVLDYASPFLEKQAILLNWPTSRASLVFENSLTI